MRSFAKEVERLRENLADFDEKLSKTLVNRVLESFRWTSFMSRPGTNFLEFLKSFSQNPPSFPATALCAEFARERGVDDPLPGGLPVSRPQPSILPPQRAGGQVRCGSCYGHNLEIGANREESELKTCPLV